MKSSEQLEREGEETRASINQTLDELRSRVTPGQLLDEIVDYARGTNGGVLVRNLGQRVVDNPLPLALIGTGLAWIMASDARARRAPSPGFEDSDFRSAAGRTADRARDSADSSRSTARDTAQAARAAAQDLAGGARSKVAELRRGVRDAASRSTDAASSALDSLRDAASDTADAAGAALDNARSAATSTYSRATRAARKATGAIGASSAALARNVQDRSVDFIDFCREQPLVVAGLGLALGAALGAALPVTAAEDRFLGEASDDVKERVQHVAGKVQASAKQAYREVADEAGDAASSGADASRPSEDTGAARAMSSAQGEDAPKPTASSADPTMMRSRGESSQAPSEDERR